MRSIPLVLATWFLFALAAGFSAKFEDASAPFVAATVWILTGLVLLASWKFSALHKWLFQVDLRWLISLHLVRFVGIYFLVLCSRAELSCAFAKPAGLGDMVVAIGAVLLLAALSRRGLQPHAPSEKRLEAASAFPLLAWNILGILDISLVVVLALRIGLADWPSMAPLRTFPLSLLPTFFVPLIIASHILIFVRLARKHGVLDL